MPRTPMKRAGRREQKRRRKYRERGLEATLDHREWIDILLLRFRCRCAYCGAPLDPSPGPGATRDHVIPAARGGGYTPDNIVPACYECNHRKGGRTPREAGMRVHVWGEVPLLPAPAELGVAR